LNDEGGEVLKIWAEWKSPHHEFVNVAGDFYMEAVYEEEYLPVSVWVPLAAEDLTALSRPQMQAILQAATVDDV
jgi:head-tail adaptor